MASQQETKTGPDLSLGISPADVPASGLLAGHVGDEAVLLARAGDEYFAIGASCPHYSGPLAEGLIVGDTVRCPWHHACISLRTGEAVRAPAFDPVARWKIERRGDKLFVTKKEEAPAPQPTIEWRSPHPSRIVIVGGGAAGFAAAEMLRRQQYQGGLVILSDDDAAPVDRPNLSKDYLAGSVPEKWLPLRPKSWYGKHGVELRTSTKVVRLDASAREVELSGGDRVPYDRLLLATGAEPVRLAVPGADQPHVHVLRTFQDSQKLVAASQSGGRAVIIGASFIGLEVAAALRTRDLEVHVVAPQQRPLERVFGAELGDFIRALHEEHGVVFHLEDEVTAIEDKRVRLKSGGALDADFVVVGIGVRPRVDLAERAGLETDRGVLVSAFMETSVPGIFAAGDIARWADRRTGQRLRVEHWVVAERQGQTAARNMLGAREPYEDVPFFWSQHYDVPINYVGHAESWDELTVDGDIAARDCLVRYKRDGRVLAVASINRDVESLQAEVMMERQPG